MREKLTPAAHPNTICARERLSKYFSHLERGFLSFGEALAKAQV
jgi:hypothetical protein